MLHEQFEKRASHLSCPELDPPEEDPPLEELDELELEDEDDPPLELLEEEEEELEEEELEMITQGPKLHVGSSHETGIGSDWHLIILGALSGFVGYCLQNRTLHKSLKQFPPLELELDEIIPEDPPEDETNIHALHEQFLLYRSINEQF